VGGLMAVFSYGLLNQIEKRIMAVVDAAEIIKAKGGGGE
jgi:hypothetical protein